LRSNWIEKSIEWLASPSIRGLLFMLMLLGAYTEFQAPGFGFPGAMAVVALLLFLGAPYLAGYTVTWEILVIFLGMCLIAVEFFVIPGFGIAGIAGIVLLIFGLAASFVPAEPGPTRWFSLPSMPATYEYLEDAFFSLVTAFLGSLVGMYLIMKYLPNVPIVGKAFAPNPVLEEIHSVEPEHYTVDVGAQGEAITLLRPAGRARFGDELVDVVSQGEYIKAGSKIRVVQRHGNRIVVARVES
jgi:membrane-bound serine protease (ClpP class)